jgi:hypothetical protein
MLNVISSAIVNTREFHPCADLVLTATTAPPSAMISVLNKLGGKTHKTLHHEGIDEDMVSLFLEDTDGKKLRNNYIMGKRNYVIVQLKPDGLEFDYRVEVTQGEGVTKSYPVIAPRTDY